MRLELKTTWEFRAEGDDREFMHRLRVVDENWAHLYQAWIDDCSPMFDDEHDSPICGRIAVKTADDLGVLLGVAMGSGMEYQVVAMGESDGRSAHVSLPLFSTTTPAQCRFAAAWEADANLFSRKLAEVAEAARDLLAEALDGEGK